MKIATEAEYKAENTLSLQQAFDETDGIDIPRGTCRIDKTDVKRKNDFFYISQHNVQINFLFPLPMLIRRRNMNNKT